MANPFFNAEYYLEKNPDVAAAVGSDADLAEQHYFLHGADEALNKDLADRKPAPWFDIQFYANSRADLADVPADLLFLHFVTHGMREGLSPMEGVEFDPVAYASAEGNEDLLEAFGIEDVENLTEDEALLLQQHFFAHGYREGREGGPEIPGYDPDQPDLDDLKELLSNLQSANDNLADAIDTFEDDHSVTILKMDDVAGAVDAAEQAIDAHLAANSILGSSTAYDEVEATWAVLGKQDALEDARLGVIRAEVAAQATTLQTALATATTNLNAVDTSLQNLVESVLRAQAALVTALATETAAQNRLAATVADFLASNSDTVTTATALSDATGATVTITIDGDNLTAVYDAATEKWVVDPALKNYDLSAIKSDAETAVSTSQSVETSAANVTTRLEAVEEADGGQVEKDADDELVGLDGEALAYAEAKQDITDYNTASAALEKLITAVEKARADAAEIASLLEEVESAEQALEDAGYAVFNLEDAAVEFATEGDDVFVLGSLSEDGEAATINDFGFEGTDVLYIGDAYTFNEGKFATDGDDTVLEFFVKQVGTNTVIQFEIDPFSSNPVVNQSFEITLVGVDAEQLSFNDGFLTIA